MEFNSLIIFALLGFFGFAAAYLNKIHLGQFSPFLTKVLVLIVSLLITGLAILFWIGILSIIRAEQLTVGFYSLAGGLFLGGSLKNLLVQKRSGPVEYLYSSLFTTVFPTVLAVIIISFGIYRTNLLLNDPLTPIGVSSGFSLIAFGLYGWSLHIVPEFCRKGILLLDKQIAWDNVLSYRWYQETVLQIEYYNKQEELCEFRTYIPTEDKAIITATINKHLMEKLSNDKSSSN